MSAGMSNSNPSSSDLIGTSAFYKLRFFNDPRGQNLLEANGRIQLEGSYEKNIFRIYAKTNTDLKSSYSGESERSTFYELYGSVKPSSNLKFDVGKKTMKWGKGYAWNPVAFVDRPKDPDDPEQAHGRLYPCHGGLYQKL